jgi:tRNA-(ms[2]io[6]A)-hydroxylase
MKYRIDLVEESPKAWIKAVMSDFSSFLIDHANCERKASAMAMGLVAKYPNRVEIIPELIEIGIEELDHFKDVYALMEERGIRLPDRMEEDLYIKQLLDNCRTGREERFMDRLLLASLVETRGAERFRLVYENLEEGTLKKFYHQLWASEARHGEVFVRMGLNYFNEESVYGRLDEMKTFEAEVIKNLPIKAALH